ncbi:serine/threonine-protein kinase [Microtetraspora sp. NBRC 16547]|uniref:serine/threonine-protein kinase n=1 Tax=Microtetraspora sp. NBRC 16547 TaxID=3030993 RepID=UPI0024A336D6|nr:serine/threonine-protein kinase [Microtetraspora sp. NBRC 16547]GLW98091.1 hypothetical protein Misp02_21780 [Microtetraspora sp. NBRC 16547]
MSRLSPLRPEDPRRLGDYLLDGRLGAGGQGVVFLATGPGGSPVAVKLLHARLIGGGSERRRFIGEIEAVRRVAPFCTAQVLDADLDGDRPYIVSEYVDGVSLQENVTANGPRSDGALDRIAVGTATALAAIHRAGVVHRDFKPGNVLIGADGPRVIDFGISRLLDATTTTGGPVGTPAYLTPEQLRGEPAGPAGDMFSWALTVAYAASGRHAFAADTYAATMGRILYGTPDLGPLAGSLREIVIACLASEPRDRPGAEEVLSRLLDGGPAAAATTAPVAASDETGERAIREAKGTGRRRRWPVAVAVVAAAAALATVAGGAVFLTTRDDAAVGGGGGGGGGGAVARESDEVAKRDLDGMWTGVARYPEAARTFPLEIYLSGSSRMRWGADLHCEGRLTREREKEGDLILRLDRVTGKSCYPGSVVFRPKDDRSATVDVIKSGNGEIAYSGTLARGP